MLIEVTDKKILEQIENAKAIIESDPDILSRIGSLAEFKRIFGFRLFRLGNKKLRNSKKVKFLIWNIPAVSTCPYATADCIRLCYAKRIERYESPRNFRARNYLLSLESWFEKLVICELQLQLNTRGFKNAEFVFVRIHESGDFYSLDYLLKWTRIADFFLYDSRIFFGLYTKSFPFFIGLDLPRNMTPSASLWEDTPEEQKALVADLVKSGWQVYTADTAEGIAKRRASGNKFHKCSCTDCGNCAYCYRPHKGTETVVEIH